MVAKARIMVVAEETIINSSPSDRGCPVGEVE